jgi:hypothetical protein
MHGFAAAGLIVLTFAIYPGLAPIGYLGTAIPVGTLWLLSLLAGWRWRIGLVEGLGLPILLFGHMLARQLLSSEPHSYFFQWLGGVLLVTGGLLSVFRARVLRFCHLEKTPTGPDLNA